MKKNIYILEILIAFIVIDAINFYYFPDNLGFKMAPLHPYWIVVLFIPARYGFIPGVFAGVIAALHFGYFIFGGIPSRLEIEKIAETQGLLLPIAFVLLGIFLGAIRQKYKDIQEDTSNDLNETKDVVEALKTELDVEQKARNMLESRIVGETATVKTLYEASKKLEAEEIDSIYKGCLELLATYLNVEKSSVYIKEGNSLVLKSFFGWSEGGAVEGRLNVEESIMSIAVEEKRIITVKDILQRKDAERFESQYGHVLAMIPMMDGSDKVVGIVNIEKIDFFHFNKTNLDQMQLIVEWTSREIKSKRYDQSIKSKLIFDEEKGLFLFNYFFSALDMEVARIREFGLNLSLSFLKLDEFGFFDESVRDLILQTFIGGLKRKISQSDMLFQFKYDGTFAVISPMKDSARVKEDLRLFKDDFKAMLEKENVQFEVPEVVFECFDVQKETKDMKLIVNEGLKKCRIPPV